MRNTWIFGCLVALGTTLGAEAIVPFPMPRPVEPPPSPGWTYQWIPAAYRAVTERVWVEDRRDWVTDCIEIRPGQWAEVRREVITPAHWETRTRRELIRPGYWALVQIDVPPHLYPTPRPIPAPMDRTVSVEGYARSGGEDLSQFTPLKEWPK